MGVRFGKYVLHERIAAGGMAEVWRATLPGADGIDKPCVLKRILPGHADDPEFVAMFRDEARISISLQHGNIVPVFDFGEVGGSFYLAMEHVAGRDLRAVIARTKRDGSEIPVEVATLVGMDVCRGLAYAHAKKGRDGRPLDLVHRDVSPSNVLLSFEGEVRLVDFGIAKARARTSRTDASTLKGKIPYMSPEQARGEPVDARTDIYATGVLLYEMLTGRRPFEGRDEMHTLELVRSGEVVPPRVHRPAVPADLDEAVACALARAPADRFQSAGAMQVVLSRFLSRHDSTVTNARVAEFVRGLYPDEAARLDPGRVSGAPPPPPTDPFERALLEAAGASLRSAATVPAGEPDGHSAGTAATSRTRRFGWRRIAGAVGLMALVAAISATVAVVASTDDAENVTSAPESALAPSPRETRSSGWVRIDSDPSGAVVTVDGRRLSERTPTLVEGLPPGGARLEVTLDGHAPWTKTVRVEPGKGTSVRAALEPRDAGAPAALRARPSGTLGVNAVPWAEVWVDGRRRAESTPAFVRLGVGRHVVRLVNPDLGLERTERVDIQAGETTNLVVRLREE